MYTLLVYMCTLLVNIVYLVLINILKIKIKISHLKMNHR